MVIGCPKKLWNNIHKFSLSKQVLQVNSLKSNGRDGSVVSNRSAQPWCGTFHFCELFTRCLSQFTPCFALPPASQKTINGVEVSPNGATGNFFYLNGYFMAIRTIIDISNSDDRKWKCKNIFGHRCRVKTLTRTTWNYIHTSLILA